MKDRKWVYAKGNNRAALGIVKAYMELHENATIEELRSVFSLGGKSLFTEIERKGNDVLVDGESVVGKKHLFIKEKVETFVIDGKEYAMKEDVGEEGRKIIESQGKEHGIVFKGFENAVGEEGGYEIKDPTEESNEEEDDEDSIDIDLPKKEDIKEKKDDGSAVFGFFGGKWIWFALAVPVVAIVISLLKGCDKEQKKDISEPIVETVEPTIVETVEPEPVKEEEHKEFPTITNKYPFRIGKTNLHPKDAKAYSDWAKQVLESAPDADIVVNGYACNIGSDKACDRVSKKRAEVVKKILVKAGFSSDKVQAVGHGKRENKEVFPSAKNNNEYRKVIVEVKK